MKRILILFGVLDISVIILTYGQIFTLWTAGFNPMTFSIELGYTLLYLSLGFSAYFLLRKNKIGLWVTYAQFPFKYLTSSNFSFTFLWSLNFFVRDFFFPTDIYVKDEYLLIKGLVGLEFVRLAVTIFIHIKSFKRPADALT